MKRPAKLLVAGSATALVLCASVTQAACGDALPQRGRLVAEAPGLQLAFVPQPVPLLAGKPFMLDIVVCSDQEARQPTRVAVDAEMPAHKHGMNYRAVVKPAGAQRYRAEGLLFHMPGRWRFLFEVEFAPGQIIRLNREVDVP